MQLFVLKWLFRDSIFLFNNMDETSLLQFYLKDAKEAIADISRNLRNIEKLTLKLGTKFAEDEVLKRVEISDQIKENVKQCINNIRNLTMICWMAGKDEKNIDNDFLSKLKGDNESFFTSIINYLTRTTAKSQIVVEILKLFEIMIRSNELIRVGLRHDLIDGKILQSLSNQTLHKEQNQIIMRWILKIYYLYTIYETNFRENYKTLYDEYIKNYKDKK